jgi:thiamine-monophosphate kinase
MASEFDLIRRHFNRPALQTLLGVGDDAALISLSAGMELAVSTDMLVSGTHFFPDAEPYQLGWKSLAVNLSDMAAMGALAKWATLAIALPQADEAWLEKFSNGFFACAEKYRVDLIGGDTTRGPLTISVQIMGEVLSGKVLKRSGAKTGDEIWVSGTLGDAALALTVLQGGYALPQDQLALCLPALLTPLPRVELGLALRAIAHSAIDISDGLLADLGHILECSEVGAEIRLQNIPCSFVVSSHFDDEQVQRMVLSGGDDYELCFTAPKQKHREIVNLSKQLALPLSCIGRITGGSGLIVSAENGDPINFKETGFDHFS